MPKKPLNFGDIYLATLDPTRGSEMQKTRPCVIVSPNVMNAKLKTIIIAPLTSNTTPLPFRVKSKINNQDGMIALDQIRSVDKKRLLKELGALDKKTAKEMSERLIEIFS